MRLHSCCCTQTVQQHEQRMAWEKMSLTDNNLSAGRISAKCILQQFSICAWADRIIWPQRVTWCCGVVALCFHLPLQLVEPDLSIHQWWHTFYEVMWVSLHRSCYMAVYFSIFIFILFSTSHVKQVNLRCIHLFFFFAISTCIIFLKMSNGWWP